MDRAFVVQGEERVMRTNKSRFGNLFGTEPANLSPHIRRRRDITRRG